MHAAQEEEEDDDDSEFGVEEDDESFAASPPKKAAPAKKAAQKNKADSDDDDLDSAPAPKAAANKAPAPKAAVPAKKVSSSVHPAAACVPPRVTFAPSACNGILALVRPVTSHNVSEHNVSEALTLGVPGRLLRRRKLTARRSRMSPSTATQTVRR